MRRVLLLALLSFALVSGLASRVPAANLQLQIATAPHRDPPYLGKLELFARPRNAPSPAARFAERVADTTELVLRFRPAGDHTMLEAHFWRKWKGKWKEVKTVRPTLTKDGCQEAVCRWDTEPESNKPKTWRAIALMAYRGTQFWWVERSAVWQPFNTVLHGSFDMLIKHVPGDAPHVISWEITHLKDAGLGIDPRYRVEVNILPLGDGPPLDTILVHQVPLGAGSITWQPDPARMARNTIVPPGGPASPKDTERIYTYSIKATSCCSDDWPLTTLRPTILARYYAPVAGDTAHIDMVVKYQLTSDLLTGEIEFFCPIDGEFVRVGLLELKGKLLKKGVHWAPNVRVKAGPDARLWTTINGTSY